MGMRCTENHVHKLGFACKKMVSDALFEKYVKDQALLAKYRRWLLDSYVEGQRQIKWCPKAGCTLAVTYPGGGTKSVQCRCSHSFCFSCLEDAHAPAPCDLVQKWLQREKSDDATQIWLSARTKQCPKCEVRIEKNKACNHMSQNSKQQQKSGAMIVQTGDHGEQRATRRDRFAHVCQFLHPVPVLCSLCAVVISLHQSLSNEHICTL
jgi:hypothetical protein